VNQGVPLLQSGVKDPLTKGMRKLVELLIAADPAIGDPAGKPLPVLPDVVERSEKRTKARHAARRWRRTRPSMSA
jgi:hypothetical protein